MKLSQAYLEWEQETVRRGIEEGMQQGMQRGIQQGMQRGMQQGMQQGQRQVVSNLLKARFGELDEQLTAIISQMLELPPQEYASLLLQLSSLEREKLLERFRAQN